MISIRDITAEVGAAVLRAAVAEDVAEGHGEVGPRELSHMCKVRTHFLSIQTCLCLSSSLYYTLVNME